MRLCNNVLSILNGFSDTELQPLYYDSLSNLEMNLLVELIVVGMVYTTLDTSLGNNCNLVSSHSTILSDIGLTLM